MEIFLIPACSIAVSSEETFITKRQYTALDGRVHNSYTDAADLLIKEKVYLILVWEAAVNYL